MIFNVGVIGTGLIGSRRARLAAAHPECRVRLVVDTDLQKAEALAKELHCEAAGRWQEAVERPDLHALVVAVPTDTLAEVSLAGALAGKHLLVEKPFGRNPEEVARVVRAARERGVRAQAGFHLRDHAHLNRAWEHVHSGAMGPLHFARCVYGHGGRLGYEQDWRCQPDRVAGGELLDQGVHVMDLFRWFLGEFAQGTAVTQRAFWNTPLEDNAFGLLTTPAGQTASFHVSWTLWKNQFAFELFGERGYLKAGGLGGGYGPETLVIGRRAPTFGVPEEERLEFPNALGSWTEAWAGFVKAVQVGREPTPSLADGCAALTLVWKLYDAARSGRPVPLGVAPEA